MSHRKNLLARLRRCTSGVATTELALSLPFLLGAGLGGVELANFGVTNMKVSQLAVHIADNASRIGETSDLSARKIYEADINDLLLGAHIQSGNAINLFEHGRVIVSSLEVDSDDDQYIHWQRCMGTKTWNSSYGEEGDRLSDGMGPAGYKVMAIPDEAVIFVEVAYDYQPLVTSRLLGDSTITAISSFTVRANRDLTQIFQRDNSDPDPIAGCTRFDNDFAGWTDGSGMPIGGGSSFGGSSSGGSSSSSGGSSGGSSSTSGGSASGGSTSGGSTTSSSTSGGSSSWGGSSSRGGSSSWGGSSSRGGSSSWGGGR